MGAHPPPLQLWAQAAHNLQLFGRAPLFGFTLRLLV
jgi:hypothetical protein